MGAADIVPGVSGGTVAFLTGIFERLLRAVTSADREAFGLILEGRLSAFWHRLDGPFVATLLAGILSAVFLLANTIQWLLINQPQPTFSLFWGLITASSIMLIRNEVLLNRPSSLMFFFFGAGITAFLAMKPVLPFFGGMMGFFFGGVIGICAMILPGISGSLILVILGLYSQVLTAITTLDWQRLGLLAMGAILGLMIFSRLFLKLLTKYRSIAMAFLSGALVGSLVAVWPWRIHHASDMFLGTEKVFLGRPVLPYFEVVSEPQFFLCFLAASTGLFIALSIDALAGAS